MRATGSVQLLPVTPTRARLSTLRLGFNECLYPERNVVMPTDPVYNPHLPSSSLASTSGSPWSSSSSSSSMSSSESCSSWSSLAAGLCAGACAGAALALIFTPMRGSDMRSSVRSYASEGGARLSELIESGRCLAEDAVHQASSLIEEGRRAFRTRSGMLASSSDSSSLSSMPTRTSSSSSSSQPLTASVAEISGLDRRFEEPLGG